MRYDAVRSKHGIAAQQLGEYGTRNEFFSFANSPVYRKWPNDAHNYTRLGTRVSDLSGGRLLHSKAVIYSSP